MLHRIEIQDFALIETLALELSPGFGAMTGETGAGKSIVLDAVAFALGARVESGWLREGASRAEVTLECDVPAAAEARELLAQWEIEPEDGRLILRRTLDAQGRSRAWVQGVAVTLGQLRSLGAWIADIHGQHAHHALLQAATQRRLLDRYADAAPQVAAVAAAWHAWQEAEQRYREALTHAAQREEERERLRYWLDEWAAIAFDEAMWQAWEEEHRRLAHAAEIASAGAAALAALSEGEVSATELVAQAIRTLRHAAAHDPRLHSAVALLESAEAEIAEAEHLVRAHALAIEADPERLHWLESRLASAVALARKHRVDAAALPKLAEQWQARLEVLEASADLTALETARQLAQDEYAAAAAALSALRQEAAARLSAAVTGQLPALALPHARFAVALLPVPPGPHGMEQVQFRFAANPGQSPGPMDEIASGGELARVGLALQVVAAGADDIPTVVFDEVDVGIGGAVAAVVGRLLAQLGRERQVLAVTHQPQVAAWADWHARVEKRFEADRAVTHLMVLDEAARREELARMLGGTEVGEEARAQAEALRREALRCGQSGR